MKKRVCALLTEQVQGSRARPASWMAATKRKQQDACLVSRLLLGTHWITNKLVDVLSPHKAGKQVTMISNMSKAPSKCQALLRLFHVANHLIIQITIVDRHYYYDAHLTG